MKNLFSLIFFLTLLESLSAQSTGSIKGKIVDLEFNKEPILHANIQIKNTPHTVQTNFNGNFEIEDIAVGPYILEVSFAGYDTVEIPIDIVVDNITTVKQGLTTKSIDIEAILSEYNSKNSAYHPVLERGHEE